MEDSNMADKTERFGSLRLVLRPGIEAKAVHGALDKIFELAGCPSCGFNGIMDVHLHIVNPAIADKFGGIAGVLSAGGQLTR
jgi:hypothetical protein